MLQKSSLDDAKEKLNQLIKEVAAQYGRYYSIFLYLIMVPEEQKQLSFTFTEISKILEFNLPKSAYKHQAWWSNTESHPHAIAWMNAGWVVADVFLPSEIVVFYRKGNQSVINIPIYIKKILNHKHIRKYPDSQILSNWIRFCRQVGWYFEGVVLFEKGGLRLDVLNEPERLETEEDYDVCRKKLSGHKTNNPFYPTDGEKK